MILCAFRLYHFAKHILHLEKVAYEVHIFHVIFESLFCKRRDRGHVGGLAADDVFVI